MSPGMTRRDFLKSNAALAGAVYLGSPVNWIQAGQSKSRVVLVRHKDVLDDLNKPRPDILQQMLDDAIAALTGEKEKLRAWQKIVSPDDTVGIKSNVWNRLPTPPALEQAIEKRVVEAGVAPEKISTRDRGLLSDPIFQSATALINTRPMRTHDWSGVGSLIKNYIMFVNKPYEYHDDSCADLAAIWKLPVCHNKTRLNVLVMLTPLFHGTGPHHFNPQYVWGYNGIIAGFDPVAVDSVGVRIISAKRKQHFGEERPINPPPKHIYLADTRHGLGTADPSKIELITLGWQEDLLL